jgi:hypothetical protein
MIRLDAEITGALSGLTGLRQTTTVLEQTFNDVDLVGRPLTRQSRNQRGC